MNVVIGILLAISLLIFTVFSLLAIKSAARFRYLSPRTVYLTVFYVGTTTTLVLLAIATYFTIVLN